MCATTNWKAHVMKRNKIMFLIVNKIYIQRQLESEWAGWDDAAQRAE